MGCGQNSGRCFLLTICCLQIVGTAERQVFDFLGFMWLPIIANFFNLIFVIFGFFGAYQYKPKYILIYAVWLVAWLGWNVFVTCFYLNVGLLDNRADWLNFGTGSASWWEVNGPGCRAEYPSNLTAVDPLRPLRPARVRDCVMDAAHVEVLHAAVHAALGMAGLVVALYLLFVLTEEDDTCKAKMRATSIYSVEYSPNTEDSGDSIDFEDNRPANLFNQQCNMNNANPHQATMTPRRVKRHNRNRSSSRSRQPSHPTPETNFANNYTSSGNNFTGSNNDCNSNANNFTNGVGGVGGSATPNSVVGGSVGSLSGANTGSIHSITGNLAGRSYGRNSQRRSAAAQNRQSGRNRRPHYLNPVTQLMDDSSTSTDSQKIVGLNGAVGLGVNGRLGHSNPMYVHSRPGSLHSLVAADPVERPPSVHSSYSNYHGVRASLNQNSNNISNLNSINPVSSNNISSMNSLVQQPNVYGVKPLQSQPGNSLSGSQNSILSSATDARSSMLINSDIRVPNIGLNAVNTAMNNAGNANAQRLHPAAVNTYNNQHQLPQSSITSVTNISPSSVNTSDQNINQGNTIYYQQLQEQQQQLQQQSQPNYQLQQQQQQQLTQMNLNNRHKQRKNQFQQQNSNTNQFNQQILNQNHFNQQNVGQSHLGQSGPKAHRLNPHQLTNIQETSSPRSVSTVGSDNRLGPGAPSETFGSIVGSVAGSDRFGSIAGSTADRVGSLAGSIDERPPPYVLGPNTESVM